jgi:hypothetical protein
MLQVLTLHVISLALVLVILIIDVIVYHRRARFARERPRRRWRSPARAVTRTRPGFPEART